MSRYSLAPLVSALLFLSLSIFVLRSKPRSRTKVVFAFACATTFFWQFIWSVLFSVHDKQLGLFLIKLGYSDIIFIPISFFHFVIAFLDRKRDWVLIGSYILTFVFFVLIWTSSHFISGSYTYSWGFYPKAGLLHPAYLFLLITVVSRGIYLLIKDGQACKDSPVRHNQIKYVLWAMFVYAFASLDFFVNYGIDFYPMGFVFILFCLGILAYAILKHHLMDIDIVLRKSVVYSFLVTSITLLYLIIVWFLERIFQTAIGYRSLPATIFAFLTVAIVFQPLKNRIQWFVDFNFFKGTIESLAEEKEKLQEEVRRTDQLRVAATLASGIAHEIKNPLTNIKTFTSFLSERHQDKAFVEKFRTVVGEEFVRIEGLVKDLLDFARPHPPTFEKVDIHIVLERVIDLVSHNLEAKNIRPITSFTDTR